MATLIVHVPGNVPHSVDLTEKPIIVGRAAHCDVRLFSEEVSREHAHIWIDENGCAVVADQNSKNGTRVDGGEIYRGAARIASKSIRIGDFELELVGAAPPPAEHETVRFKPDLPTAVGERSFYRSTTSIDLNQQRLTLLMSLTERIGGAFERKQLLQEALDACCETLGFERGLIALRTSRGDTELPVTRNIQRDETGAYTVSRTLINRALLHGECAVVNDPAVDLVGNISESLVRFPICSALCVPILHRDEILGVIYGDRITQASTYTPEDSEFLAAIAQQVGVGLANLRMFERHVQMQKVMEEIKQARTIQQRLLPAQPLCAGRVTLAGFNAPSSAVGGDYFDYFALDDGRIGLVIADVTGHGLGASLVMANFQSAVHVTLTGDILLTEAAMRLNRLVCRSTPSSVFITAILGRLNPKTGHIEYVNAGHHGPLLLHRQDVRFMPEGLAFMLGFEPDTEFHLQEIPPADDLDAVLFYTDGLIEAANSDGQLLDLDPVADALKKMPQRTTETLIRTALSVVDGHVGASKYDDDLTLLALQYGRQ